ncbi:hypothetical protein APED_18685 [Acanthopleuribacter pedis]
MTHHTETNGDHWILAGHQYQASRLSPETCIGSVGSVTVLADMDAPDQPRLRRKLGEQNLSGAALVAAGFTRLGAKLAAELRGSYSLIIWDRHHRRLTLALDPLGAKTLYYHALGENSWAIATHARTLRHLAKDRPPEPRAALMWCLNEYDTRFSMWQDIHGLRPGEWLTFNGAGEPDGKRRGIHRDHTGPVTLDRLWSTLQTCVAEATDDATRTHAMLSGGLDSSSVAAAFTHHHGRPPSCHAFAFETLHDCAEQAFSQKSAEELGAPLHLYNAEQFPAFYRQDGIQPPENPFQSNDPLEYAVFQKINKLGGQTLLTGHGGDTLFTNPPQSTLLRFPWRANAAASRNLFTKAKRAWQVWLAHLPPDGLQRAKARRRGLWKRHPAWLRQTALQTADPWSLFDLIGLPTGLNPLTHYLHTRMTRDAAGVRRAIHWYNRAALETGIHIAHPLFDERLADLILCLSREAWHKHPEPKGLQRDLLRSFTGLGVCERLEKPTLTAYYHAGIKAEQAFLTEACNALDAPWFDQKKFCHEVETFCAGTPPYPTADFLSAAWYLVWLSQDFTSN